MRFLSFVSRDGWGRERGEIKNPFNNNALYAVSK